jgi:fatty-acyl-CoA synthase
VNDDIDARRVALLTRFPVWEPVTLSRFLARSAGEYGDRPFVITDERTVSYAQIDAWATELADGLAALGVRPGDRVGVLMANYLEFVPVKFAVARVGAVAIPFNYLYRQDELGYVLRQSRCHVLISMTSFGGLDYLAMLDAIAPGWPAGPTAQLPDLRRVVLLDAGGGRGRGGVPDVAGLAALGRQHPGAAGALLITGAVTPDSPGDILYTSGTTGLPKGVVVTHDAVLRTSYASALTRAYADGRRILFSLPCYHMFGYVEGLLSVMFVGGAIIPRTAFSPGDYFASIERHRATEILAVPTMTVALLEHPDRAACDLSSLTAILSGAAPAPVWVWQKVRSELGISEITTGYGMTECGGAMTLTRPEDPLEIHASTVGRPKLAGAAGLPDGGDLCVYKTVDPLTGEDLPVGAEGELVSTGPTHMLGYWDKPEETAQALRGGWVYSGDLGVVRPDGYLKVTGRSKELYKSGGELVMPKEIEDLLTRHPGVSQAFVVGLADERWGDVGCAWIVPEPGADVDAAALIALCREKLARFKVPKHVLFLDPAELPTTPTGKVQKFRLARRAADRIASAPPPLPRLRCSFSRDPASQGMAEPPPTAMTWPVTWRAASGEEIHSTAPAMSAAVVIRRSGCCLST